MFIRTTATAVQKIKMAAKAIERNSDISHTKALELAAQQAGYADWHQVQLGFKNPDLPKEKQKPVSLVERVKRYSDYLLSQSRAPVEVHSTKGNVFHDVSIEGHRFRGRVLETGDIWILKLNPPPFVENIGVALGVASIRRCVVDKSSTSPEWWICKYSADEPRLDLGNMTEAGRNALSLEFGLPIVPKEGNPDPKLIWSVFLHGQEADLFYLSPAFTKLVEWAKLHVRKARSSSKNTIHLKSWMDRAIEHPSFADK